MKLLKKIWNDSVWSKIIAVILSPYVLAALVSIKGFFNEKGYWDFLKSFLTIECPIWILPIVALVAVIIVMAIVKYKNKHDIEKSVIRHQGPYITFIDKPQDQCYCSVCWDDGHKKVQLPHFYGDTFKCPKCNSEGCYDVEKKTPPYHPFYKF